MTRWEVAATVLFCYLAAVGFACQFMAALKIVHEWWWR